MPANEKVHNRVREWRNESQLTQEQLAKALGVSRQTIISIESGRYIPSLPLALKISKFFGCATDDMFQLEGK
jgi:putative transcriptional regulator